MVNTMLLAEANICCALELKGMVKVMTDGEGEVTGWEYELTAESARKHPECGRMMAKVFND